MTWDIFVRILHIIGTVLGVGGSTFAEIFYLRSNKKLPPSEDAGRMLKTVYTVIRVGTAILVLSGFGFLLLARLEGEAQHIYSPRVWAKLLLTLIILLNALLLHSKKLSYKVGSAISITSWYAALIIGAWRMHATFWQLMGIYAVSVAVVMIIQNLIYKRLEEKV